jgi:hypothetical protein
MGSELRWAEPNGRCPLRTRAGKRLAQDVDLQRVGNLPGPVWNKIDAHRSPGALHEGVMRAQPLQFVTANVPQEQMVVRVECFRGVVEFKFANDLSPTVAEQTERSMRRRRQLWSRRHSKAGRPSTPIASCASATVAMKSSSKGSSCSRVWEEA